MSVTPVTPVVTNGIALQLSSSTLTVPEGSSANTSASLTRTGTTGSITFSATGLPAGALVLEITESVLTPPGPELLDRLRRLKELGVLLAVDDFGAGHSSLNHLRTLPVDVLKIDKVFVDGAGRGGQDDVLLRAIIELGHSLGLTVVAEGVEDAEQLTAVRRLGCEQAQGFLLGRPSTSADLEGVLRLRGAEHAPVA